MSELITIAMPVYNCSNYLNNAIKSILAQTYSNWELLIVDDCSTDKTLEILLNFNDERIKLHRNTKNIGLAASLNLCISNSKGKYIARMDGDDIMLPNRLEIQYKYLEENQHLDAIGGLAYLVDSDNNFIGYKKRINTVNFKTLLLNQGIFIHPTVMAKKEWFIRHKYDPSIKRGQDLELWIRSYNTSNFSIVDEYLIFYREIGDEYKLKYYNVYVALKLILLKHKAKISYIVRFYLIARSYIKYILFDIFKSFGLIQGKQNLTDLERNNIQNILNKIIK